MIKVGENITVKMENGVNVNFLTAFGRMYVWAHGENFDSAITIKDGLTVKQMEDIVKILVSVGGKTNVL